MIELNLLPEESKKRKRKLELPDIPIIPAAAILIGAIVVIQLLLGGLIFVGKKQLAGLDKTWESLAPERARLDGIKGKISAINKKTKAIDSLMAKQINWSRLLNELSDSVTANIWLTEISCSETIEKETRKKKAEKPGKPASSKPKIKKRKTSAQNVRKIQTLTIAGFAAGRGEETTANVGRFISSLKGNKDFFEDFADVELVSMKKSVVAEQDVMNFTLVCRRVPRKKGE